MSEIPEALQRELDRLEAQYQIDVNSVLKELDRLKGSIATMGSGLKTIENQVKQLATVIDGIAAKTVTNH